MSKMTLAEHMQKDAADAVRVTDDYFFITLDYSEESIANIEELIESNEVHYSLPGGKSPDNINLLCRVWGAYLGEVFRRHGGGSWITWEDEYGKTIALEYGGTKLFPRDKVRKRLVGTSEHNLLAYYETMRDLKSGKK